MPFVAYGRQGNDLTEDHAWQRAGVIISFSVSGFIGW